MFISEQYNVELNDSYEWLVAELVPTEFFKCWEDAVPDFLCACCGL